MKSREERVTYEERVKEITALIKKKKPRLNEKKFVKWLLSRKKRLGVIPFDSRLVYEAYNTYKKLRDDFDNWVVVSAKEGFGKTTLSEQWAYMISDKVTTCFNYEETRDALEKSRPDTYESIILDEGGTLLLSRESLSQTSRWIVKAGMVCRQNHVNFVINAPNFFLLDNYIRDHRVDLLLQIKKRGEYRAVFGSGIKTVSRDGARYKNVIGIKIRSDRYWDGKFRKTLPIAFDYKQYLAQKQFHMKQVLSSADKDLNISHFMKASRVGEMVGVTKDTVVRWIKNGTMKGKQIGGHYFVDKKSYREVIGGGV